MFLLYYRPNCPFSINSDKLMTKLSLPHKTIKINRENDVIKDQLYSLFEHNTYPAIIYYKNGNNKHTDTDTDTDTDLETNVPSNGIFIGGNREFTELISNVKKLNSSNIKKTYNSFNNSFNNVNNISYRDYLLISNYIITQFI